MFASLRLWLCAVLMAGVLCAQSVPAAPASPSPNSDDTDDMLSFIAALSQLSESPNGPKDQLSYTVRFSEIYDSNPLSRLKKLEADHINSFGGSLGLAKSWRHTALTANYVGGADYYAIFDKQNQMYQHFNGAESFDLGGAKLLVGGDYERLPASAFGFAATHQIVDTYYTLINPDLVPNQSIQTPLLERTSRTAIVQLGLRLSDRSSLDISGSYARLRYEKNGIAGTNQAGAGLGYSFALSSRDSVGVAYQHGIFQTSHNNPLQVMDSVVTASYAHRFTDNLVVKLGVGPDLRTYTGTKSKLLQGVDPTVSANAQLDYAVDRTHFNVGYWRSTVSGQGVLDGGDNDQIQLTASQSLGHDFELSSSFGYSRSTSLARVVQARKVVDVDNIFNSEFFSVSLNKRLAGSVSLIFGYALQNQNASAEICVSGLCQDYPAHHVFTFGFAISPKPIDLRRKSSREE